VAELKRIGRLGKPWGNKGELALHLDAADPDRIEQRGWVFLDIDGQEVPFPVVSITDKGRDLLIKFDEVDDPQAAAVLVGRDVLFERDRLDESEEADWQVEDLIGMQVTDEVHGALGEVVSIAGTEDNPVLVIAGTGTEILVPAAEGIVTAVDPEARTITVRTPEGLVDLYRG
jgi:16S rRNA processing protein RimM